MHFDRQLTVCVSSVSAVDCKEKWRNLRTVFTRKMKTALSASGTNNKAYYLADAMQFSVPFIKTLVTPSTGNLPDIPQRKTADETLENADVCDLADSPPSPPPTPLPSQRTDRPQEQSSSSRIKDELTFKNKSAMEADKRMAEYFNAKKARMEAISSTAATNSHNSEHKEALEMFLLSLIPEVEHFNNDQIKLFKRKVFNVIDDISSQP